jgi:hypothetical protein
MKFFMTLLLLVGFAHAAQAAPKEGDVINAVFACKTEEAIVTVTEQATSEDWGEAVVLATKINLCQYIPEGVPTKLGALKQTFISKLTGGIVRIFEFKYGNTTLYTFAHNDAKGA